MHGKNLITFLILVILSNDISAYWIRIEPPGFHRFNTVHFVNNNLAFVGTADGEIYKTENGGYEWQFVNQLTTNYLTSIRFHSNTLGIAVGGNGTILRSSDMGNNWVVISPITNNWLYDIEYISEYTIIAVGNNGTIIRSTNGGVTWNNVASNTTQLLHGVQFIDSLKGFIVGWNQTILKTTDGGLNWNVEVLPYTDDYMDICFSNPMHGIAVGKWGKIIITSDGGENWEFIGTYGNGFIKACLISEDVGFAVGFSNLIFKTTNGGQSWIEQYSPVAFQGALNDVSFIDENNGMTVGTNNVLMKTEHGGLPVELASFSGYTKENIIVLNWSTETELNNHGFEIERSLDKISWITIGFIEGKGTTTEPQSYSFSEDISDISNSTIVYRLKQIDFNGNFEYSDVVEVKIAPSKFSLEQNYPNPFNPSTSIQYAISSRQFVTLKVYDVIGNEVAILVSEEKPAGNYVVSFDASKLSSGVYYYQLRAGEFVETKKMIFVK